MLAAIFVRRIGANGHMMTDIAARCGTLADGHAVIGGCTDAMCLNHPGRKL
jgi:hypothetical protein